MPLRLRVLPVLVLFALLGLGAAPAPPRAESAAKEADRILRDPRYQRALPGTPRAFESEAAAPPAAKRPSAPLRIPLPDFRGAGAVGRWVGYGFLAVAAVLLVVVLLRALLPRLAAPEPARGDDAAPPEDHGAAGDAPSLDGAQLLARQGRYVEALHLLLLAAIHRVSERRKQAPPAHLTSRELVRTLPLGPDSRQAFGELVAGVEVSLFGGGAVGEADFARGVERYRALVERRPNDG
jgi:hypothetical protein